MDKPCPLSLMGILNVDVREVRGGEEGEGAYIDFLAGWGRK